MEQNNIDLNKKQNMNSEYRYMFIIVYYFILAQLALALLIMPFLGQFIDPYDDSLAYENTIGEVLYDINGIALFDDASYTLINETYELTSIIPEFIYEDYKNFELIHGGIYKGYHVIFNSYNKAFKANLNVDQNGLDEIFLENLFTGTVSEWAAGEPIRVYVANSRNIPNVYLDNLNLLDLKHFKLVGVQAANYSSILNFIYFILLVIPMIYILKHEFIDDYKAFKRIEKEKILTGVALLFATSIVLNYVSVLLKLLFGLPFGSSVNQRAIESSMVFPGAIFMISAAVILGPLVEEIVFRHVGFKFIKNPKIALIVTSLIFGLIHVSSEPNILYAITQGITYIGLGLILGTLYLKNNQNLMTIFLIHAIYNGISVLLMFL